MSNHKPTNVGVEIKNLSKNFKNNQAIDNLSINFEPGLLHGIIGPDGAGKTTFLRILSGLLNPTKGTIQFIDNGKPIAFETIRPFIGYMPSRPSLYPDLSVEEHLMFFRDLYQLLPEEYEKKSNELLEISRLKVFKDRKAINLSGGMYKKLGLMCALLRSPSVLLLDEPTNGVDPISRRELWDLLYRLSDEKILILISTAYMDEAERCTRVHFIESGKLLESGIPEIILEKKKIKSFDDLFLRKNQNE
ncbi:MAG: ABC transporter ATP-binding protein [Elusimicrobia bacterium]|nr:ABC transporter ATP-binding protein [Elusimicrobiota bacterium]